MCCSETTSKTTTTAETSSTSTSTVSTITDLKIELDPPNDDSQQHLCHQCNLPIVAHNKESDSTAICTCSCTNADEIIGYGMIDVNITKDVPGDGWSDGSFSGKSTLLDECSLTSEFSSASSSREDGEEKKDDNALLSSSILSKSSFLRGILMEDYGIRPRTMLCKRYSLAPQQINDLDSAEKGVGSKPTPDVVPQHHQLVVFGCDISCLPPTVQFLICAGGFFSFSIVYGYLQELLSVHIAGRKYALFLATCQFAGFTFWSYVLTCLRPIIRWFDGCSCGRTKDVIAKPLTEDDSKIHAAAVAMGDSKHGIPFYYYIGLSLVRALDLGMTNMAMQYLNYPAKTLIRSSKVAFTMLLGIIIGRKRYQTKQYVAVALLVVGLGFFLHADATGDALFNPIGVMMLVVSLTCDGSLSNWSEVLMHKFHVGHDEFQLRLYGVALIAMATVAHLRGELLTGARLFFFLPGTVPEIENDSTDEDDASAITWTAWRKILALFLFSTTGLYASSFAGAITKRFGALAMSITATTRKASTLFLSFALFPNNCSFEHVLGMAVFLVGLLMKSLCARTSMHVKATDEPSESMTTSTREPSEEEINDRPGGGYISKRKQNRRTVPDTEDDKDEMIPLNADSHFSYELTTVSD